MQIKRGRRRRKQQCEFREISGEAVEAKTQRKVRRFICTKLLNTCLLDWVEGEAQENKLIGGFIYRKLLLLVELVALDQSYEAIWLFWRARRHSNMFKHACVNMRV